MELLLLLESLLLLLKSLLLLLPSYHDCTLLRGYWYAVHMRCVHHVVGHDWCLRYGGPHWTGVGDSWGWRDMTCYRSGLLDAGRPVWHLWSTVPAGRRLTATLAHLLSHGSCNSGMRMLESGPRTTRAPSTLIGRGDVHRYTLIRMADTHLTYQRGRTVRCLMTHDWRRVLSLRRLKHLLLLLLLLWLRRRLSVWHVTVRLWMRLLILSRNLLLLLLMLGLCKLLRLVHLPLYMHFSQCALLSRLLFHLTSSINIDSLLLQSLRLILLHLLLMFPLRSLLVLHLNVFQGFKSREAWFERGCTGLTICCRPTGRCI